MCCAWSVQDPLPVRPGLAIPIAEVELRTSRSSGPGGQHANVTASRVEAVFDVGASETLSEEQKARTNTSCSTSSASCRLCVDSICRTYANRRCR